MKILSLIISLLAFAKAEYKYETKWFKVRLDHFGYQRNETFEIKYLVNEDHWDRGGGPIFFYTGNEGAIEVFTKHTGFMWDIAEEFKAKLVLAEHRYYGESMPFGYKSLDNEHIGYLNSAQALADFADLIDFLQDNALRPKYPVIAFGGSYGGVLSAYLRIKYPHMVSGAISASAPVLMYPGMVPCNVYHRIVTSSFQSVSPKCVDNIRSSWPIIRKLSSDPNNTLQKDLGLCSPVKKSADLISLLEYMFSTIAMVNYPFSSDFVVPLPGQPVRYVCQYLNETLAERELIEALGKVMQTFSNYGGNEWKCVDNQIAYKLFPKGWGYQACTEMIQPMCKNGISDMFEPMPWNLPERLSFCREKYGVQPRPDAARIEYGGDRLQATSNIVFSNGLLDPWSGGGILSSISDSVVAVVIVDGAHHLDLMPANEKDPTSVLKARQIHKQHIRKWIRMFREENSF